ncbi:MAG: hypothetical protein HRU20_29925 [Pseudomonadales bacterium]|nr:hypothetical protein [Pseudomonadales bacterium]
MNEAANGGAADINGNVTAENLTFYGNKASSNGGALNVSSGASILSHVSIVGNIASTAGAVYAGAGTVELNRSLVAGNAGGNIHGTSVTFLDGEFNLVGFNDAAEISGGASLTGAASFTPTATPDAKDAAVKYFAITLEEIVDPSPNFKGGDGYQSMLKTLPLKVASIARNKIPKEECISAVDQRGETRPDYKDKKCDIGAYEYAVLTCAEDAQRRYEQGEIFVKSCAPKFEDFEFGSINQFMLSFLALMGLMSLMRVPRSK